VINAHKIHGGGGGGRRARLGVDERAGGGHGEPCQSTTRACARKTALTRRERATHTPGPSRARAALHVASGNGAMPRLTVRGRTLAELKAARHRHAGPSSRPRRAGAGHAGAGGLPWPRAMAGEAGPPWPGRGGVPGTSRGKGAHQATSASAPGAGQGNALGGGRACRAAPGTPRPRRRGGGGWGVARAGDDGRAGRDRAARARRRAEQGR
jgi:hypothetical protein